MTYPALISDDLRRYIRIVNKYLDELNPNGE